MLKIAETFTSLQGEGHLTGRLMYFIRLAGCSVTQCPLHPANKDRIAPCDTDWKYTHRADERELAKNALREVGRGGWVSVTGGEPFDQDLTQLVADLKSAGLKLNVQTSGTLRFDAADFDCVTVSPKCAPQDLLQHTGHELKLVYTGQDADVLSQFYRTTDFDHYYLMPCWADGTHNVEATIEAVRRMNTFGQHWALTAQSHKWWSIR